MNELGELLKEGLKSSAQDGEMATPVPQPYCVFFRGAYTWKEIRTRGVCVGRSGVSWVTKAVSDSGLKSGRVHENERER